MRVRRGPDRSRMGGRSLISAECHLPINLTKEIPMFAAQDRKKVKITDVKVMIVQCMRVSPLIKIETDAGIYGIGEAHHDVRGYGVKDVVLNKLRDLLIGEDPLDIEKLTNRMMQRVSSIGGNAGIAVHAVTGVEIALWDLVGKMLGVPVHKILGGGSHVDSVRAYKTGGPKDKLDKASCREYADYIKSSPQGWTGVKVDISRENSGGPMSRRFGKKDLDLTVKGFENVREALGDDIEIVVHCHWELGFHDAIKFARAIEPIDPWWLEDPMPIEYVNTWVKLTEASPVPILCGENLYTRHEFLPFIINQGVHMIAIDISMTGGLLKAKKIPDLAELYYIPVCTHNVAGPIATLASASCAASIRDFVGHETFDSNTGSTRAGVDNLIEYDREIIKDGRIQLSDKPGLGFELNEDEVRSRLLPDEEWWG